MVSADSGTVSPTTADVPGVESTGDSTVGVPAQGGCADVVTRQVTSVAFSQAMGLAGAVDSQATVTSTSADTSSESGVSEVTDAGALLSGAVVVSASRAAAGVGQVVAATSVVTMTCQCE